jgi:manganese/zinc/iron transport system permease protein
MNSSDLIQLLVLCALSLAASSLGVFLVLRKMTMLANSLSHTVLLGIVITALILAPFSPMPELGVQGLSMESLLIAALVTGVITTLLTHFLTHVIRLQEDASIALVFTVLFALGVVVVTLFTRDAHIGTEAVLGNIDALQPADLKLISWTALFNVLFVTLFFKELLTTSFDPLMAKTTGISTSLINVALMILTAATAISAFRAVGVLLFLSFLVGPPLIARLITSRLKMLLLLAVAIGVLCSVCGVLLSRFLFTTWSISLSTGALVATLIGATYGLTLLFRLFRTCRS